MNEKLAVGVIYGGQSPEHAVSCISTAAILEHLDPERSEIVPIGITRQGTWVPGTHTPQDLMLRDGQLPAVPESDETLVLSLNPTQRGQVYYLSGDRAGELFATIDVVLPILHGPFGEDGTIQGVFEMAGLPYVGSGVYASAACMDKEYTKVVLAQAGLPLGTQVVLLPHVPTLTPEEKDTLGLPVFVKPARGGSSIGISRVADWAKLDEAIAVARSCDDKVIIEAAISGDEVECGVLETLDGSLIASVPARLLGIHSEDDDAAFYDFDTKYIDDVVTAEIPADIPAAVTAELQEQAQRAFRALGCEGLARVDFFVTETGPMINEVNTFPGFTPISMYPQVLAASGVSYGELLDTLIQRAVSAPKAVH